MKSICSILLTCSIPFICMGGGLLHAATDDVELIMHKWSESRNIRLYVGTASALSSSRVAGVSDSFQPVFNEDRDYSSSRGSHISIEQVVTNMHYSRRGLQYAYGLSWDDHQGDNGDVSLQALSAQIRYGVVTRWDLSPSHVFQFELSPMLGIGLAQASVGNGADSDIGLYYSYGMLMQAVHQIDDSWQFSYGLIVQEASATVSWDNTDDSTLEASGMQLRIGMGYRW